MQWLKKNKIEHKKHKKISSAVQYNENTMSEVCLIKSLCT